ncbi:MAG: type II toxin-antitoxin system antitoxin SocA domain-containing protein [Patescibacteria group bacterium]
MAKPTKKIVNKTVSANDVAEYILAFANETGESVTNLKLQKMLYYAQAWHLANFSKPLFEEDFEAWVHGPVLPSLYQKYKVFGYAPIVTEIREKDIAKKFNKSTLEFLHDVVKVYMTHGGYELELMTHKEDPWIDARQGCEPDEHSGEVITKDSMRDYYGEKIKN